MNNAEFTRQFAKSELSYLLVDKRGFVKECNAVAKKLLSTVLSTEFLDGKANLFLYLQHSVPDEANFSNSIRTNGYYSGPLLLPALSGSELWVNIQVAQTETGDYFCIMSDITEEKHTEQTLLTEKRLAEQRTKIKSDFLANVTHEIRTPIQTIIGTMELLGETNLDTEQIEYVRQVKFSANVLLSLVNDILDFSKIESGKFQIEHILFDPLKTAERTVDLVAIEAYNRGLEIITDIDFNLPRQIWGDPHRIQQVILNLMKNAIKFTKNGYVQLHISHNPKKRTILFQIIDSGIGVSPEAQKNLFTDFFQADASTTRKYGGTGLGLAISKNLINQMNGQIGMKSNPKGGSIFWFCIPYQPENQDQPTGKALFSVPDERILIVDDHPLAIKSLQTKLHTLGIQNTTVALSGRLALSKMTSAAREGAPFTMVFIDMVMPEMDGWRLSAEINANHLINQAKLFLMIPEGQMGADAKMKMLQWFNAYIYKPVKKEALATILKEATGDSIDLEIVSPAEEIQKEKPRQIAKDMKILVAEDHPVNQKLIKTFLIQMGATVFCADNGEQAIDIVAENPDVDFIFMDIQMPIKNGVETTAELRKAFYKGVIIACTANTESSDFELYYKTGMNDILVKPFKKQAVEDILQKWTSALNHSETTNKQDAAGASLERPVWDIEELLDAVAGDKTLAEELTVQFKAQTTETLKKANEALAAKDLDELYKFAHSIKGSSAALSIKQLAFHAKELETAGRNNNLTDCQKLLPLCIADFEQFCALRKKTIL